MVVITSYLIVLLLTFLPKTFSQLVPEHDQFKCVQTEYGAVRGKLMTTIFDKKAYYSYRGIPYAKPPLKELRFKTPVEPIPWSNVLDAFEFGNECVQKSYFGEDTIGSEDCLYLNVFAPILKSTKDKLPVMVWIHGGGYFQGSANVYGPDFLLNSDDVIIVSINYRLGPFGFLSLGTANYSGNNGLKDQSFALQWVQRNIEQFGGDKDLVTIFGESAGSSSVHFQVLSPKSNGLFKRAIMQSGSATNPWASYIKSDHLEVIYDLARKLGHDPQGIEDIIDFIHRVDSELFILKTNPEFYVLGSPRKDADMIWGPVVEVNVADDPFLTKHPQEYLDDKSVKQSIDTLIGFCADEMIFLTAGEIFNSTIMAKFNEKLEFRFPRTDLRNEYNSTDNAKMTQEIRDFYFSESNGEITSQSGRKFNDLFSDVWFNYGIDQAIKSQIQRSTGNTFYYLFSLVSRMSMLQSEYSPSSPENFTAISHFDDAFYMFSLNPAEIGLKDIKSYDELSENSKERKLIQMVTKLWTDFAKYGNPTPNSNPLIFKPVNENAINFINITNDGLINGVQPYADRIEFWNRFYKKYETILQKH